MIHIGEMTELMHHHIIQYMRWSHHQPPVEGEGAIGGTASPTGLLLPDGDGVIGAACKLLKIRHALRNVALCYLTVFFLQKSLLRVRVTTVLLVNCTEFAVIFQQPRMSVPQKGDSLPV